MNNSTSTTSAGWPTRWPADSFRWLPTAIVGLPVVLFVGYALYSATQHAAKTPSLTPSIILTLIGLQTIIEAIIVGIILLALPRISKFSLAELGFRVPKPWQLGTAVLGAVAMVVVVEGLASLIQAATHQKHDQSVVDLFKQVIGTKAMWFFAFFAIVVAPFMEEMMFRVLVFNAGLRYGGFWTGAIISGLFFGSAHGDLTVLGPLALGGIILCYVYYRTRNAFCSTITHGCFNAVTVLALIYAPNLAK